MKELFQVYALQSVPPKNSSLKKDGSVGKETNMTNAALTKLITENKILFDQTKHKTELLEKASKSLQQMVVQLATNAGPIRISSVTSGTHGKTSLHYKGRAIDIGNEEKASSIVPYLKNNASSLKIDELIFDATYGTAAIAAASGNRNAYNLKHGKSHTYSDKLLKEHRNHIHVSVLPEPVEGIAYSAAVQKETAEQPPHEDPVGQLINKVIEEEHSGTSTSGATLNNISRSFYDYAEEDSSTSLISQDSMLDETWAASPSEGARLVLEMVATGTRAPESVNRSVRAIYEIAFSEDGSASTIHEALGDILGPLLANPIKENLDKIGLDPASVDEIVQLVQGSNGADPLDTVVSILRREVRKHLPAEFEPILDIASALLFDSGQANVEPVLRAVFGGGNQISNLAESVVSTGLGAGTAILGVANLGLTTFSIVQQAQNHAEVMKALESIKEDLQVIKQDLVELKQAVALLSQQLDNFSERTEERFQQVLNFMEQGFDAILQDTADIKNILKDLSRDMNDVLDILFRVERLQQVHVGITLQVARDDIRTEFTNQLNTAFKLFDAPQQSVTNNYEIELHRSLNFFFGHASVTAFSASLSLGSLAGTPVRSLEDARPLILAAPAVEYAFGLLPLVLTLSGHEIGAWHKPLKDIPDRLPNPVEFVRGTDAFLQLLAIAPADIQANYIENVDILLEIAERIRNFLFQLRHNLDTKKIKNINIQRFLIQTVDNYRNQHDITVPILADASGFILESKPPSRRRYFNYLIEENTEAKVKSMRIIIPGNHGLWIRDGLSWNPISCLQRHRLLIVEEIGEYGPVKNVSALPNTYDDWQSAKLFRLILQNGSNKLTAFMLEFKIKEFGNKIRAIFEVDDLSELNSAKVSTNKFFEEGMSALPEYHRKHWLGVKQHVKKTLENDHETIPAWEALRLAEWLIHRVRLHNDRRFSEQVLERFMDPSVGGGLKQRSDLLVQWDEVGAKTSRNDDEIAYNTYMSVGSFSLDPKTDGMLPLVEACANRLRGVGKTLDGKQRVNAIPNGLEFDQALRKYAGDNLYYEAKNSDGFRATRTVWRYYVVKAHEGEALWVQVFGWKPTIIFLDKARVELPQQSNSEYIYCYPKVHEDVVVAVKSAYNVRIVFGIGKISGIVDIIDVDDIVDALNDLLG